MGSAGEDLPPLGVSPADPSVPCCLLVLHLSTRMQPEDPTRPSLWRQFFLGAPAPCWCQEAAAAGPGTWGPAPARERGLTPSQDLAWAAIEESAFCLQPPPVWETEHFHAGQVQ